MPQWCDERLQHLLENIFEVHQAGCIDCDTCCEQFECLVEMVMSGANLGELLPAVEDHLRCCQDCREEFEALVAIMRAEESGQISNPTE